MRNEINNLQLDNISKFSNEQKIKKDKLPQSQEKIYCMHKYLFGNRNKDLNISAFDSEQNLTNYESINSSKEKLNKSQNTNYKFLGFRNSLFDLSISNSPQIEKNKNGILPPIKYNFFDEEEFLIELEKSRKRKSMFNQLNLNFDLSSFKDNSSEVKNCNKNDSNEKIENSNFSVDKNELNNLINDLDNNKIKRLSHFSNFNSVENKVNEESDEDSQSDFSDFDSDGNVEII
jgi:hypothetical protein